MKSSLISEKQLVLQNTICEYINQCNWGEANKLILDMKDEGYIYTDDLAIFEASIANEFKDEKRVFQCISKGLAYNHENYELYFMLGNYYRESNPNKAFLCYENAEYYCKTEDLTYIEEVKESIYIEGNVQVVPISIVVLSYNSKDITALCLESIRQNVYYKSYELIVIDNASTDSSVEWLKEYEQSYFNSYGVNNLLILYNNENSGFPKGCNQGIHAARKENDILLLNNDTVVVPNSIFWLRMGLYESDKIGATGSVSNYANNGQMVIEKKDSIEEWFQYGIERNIPLEYSYEKKAWLMGFALALKRTALEETGYLDERFSPGNYEDNDIGYRLLQKGYTQLLCKNSFIFHFGSVGFRKNQEKYDLLLNTNRAKLREKYCMAIDDYSWIRDDLIKYVKKDNNSEILNILDIGCGLGTTIARIESMDPTCNVYGIEVKKEIVELTKSLANVILGDIETMYIPFDKEYFDYIILGNIFEELNNPITTLERIHPYLKKDGKIIMSTVKIYKDEDLIISRDKDELLSLIDEIFEYRICEVTETDLDYILLLEPSI